MTFLILQPDSRGAQPPPNVWLQGGSYASALRLNPEQAPSAFLIRPFSEHALPTRQTKHGMQGDEGCLEK